MAPYTATADQAAFIWNIADLLRGRYKQADYGKVILPFTILRRLDCVLEPTKADVLAEFEKRTKMGAENLEPFLTRKAKLSFYNTSPLSFSGLKDDAANVLANLEAYVAAFSGNVRDIFDRFKFAQLAADLAEKNLLFKVVEKFAAADLHPDAVSNHDMGLMFENLIRRFAELSNETAGEHYTPREVIRLMVDVLFAPDEEVLTKPGVVRSFYDPTAGTGGILSIAEEHVQSMNPGAKLVVFGQELNPESYAICKADLLIKGQDAGNIVYGNTLSEDGHAGRKFDYMGANPPYGVKWEEAEEAVRREHESKGLAGRFGPGLPRINDGSLLFLLNMIAKMDPNGSRIGIVFNGSPMFTGDAGSGESSIRRWIIENDLLEAIIALPPDIFYNTGIATYVWVVTNKKHADRVGRVQLVDGAMMYAKMRKSLGAKRNYITDEQVAELVRIYCAFEPSAVSKIFRNEDFGYRQITIERPLRLNFQVNPERVARLRTASGFAALTTSRKHGAEAAAEVAAGEQLQVAILSALDGLSGMPLVRNRAAFTTTLRAALDGAGLKVAPALLKAILAALSERDPTADVCRDSKGRPEPDLDLRDIENLPLTADIDEFFEREIRPYTPDAWIATAREKIGYEIQFTRYFFKYGNVRPLENVRRDLAAAAGAVQDALAELLA